MKINNARSAIFAFMAFGAGLGISGVSAQVGYVDPSNVDVSYAQLYNDYNNQSAASTIRNSTYDCSFNELHTRLETKGCGGNHFRY